MVRTVVGSTARFGVRISSRGGSLELPTGLNMGALPPAGQWARLEAPAHALQLEGGDGERHELHALQRARDLG